MGELFKKYIHNPAHLFCANANYIITGATLYKTPIIKSDKHKQFFLENLFFFSEKFRWEMQAYVIMDNHYHFLAYASEGAQNLPLFIQSLHRFTAKKWNKIEGLPGRKVWYNYWDTCITAERSYYARFNYIHHNPVKHGVVKRAEDYPWSSYRMWLEKERAAVAIIEANYPFERVKVIDDF